MNSAAILYLLIAASATGSVTVSTLDGERIQGELSSLDSEAVTIDTSAGMTKVPTENLMLLEVASTDSAPASLKTEATLIDGSKVTFRSVTADAQNVSLDSESIGLFKLTRRQVASMRWAEVDDKVAESWQDLQTRGARDDLLVIRKGDVLDYVGGTLTQVTAEGITLSVRGRNLTAPLDRIFGVVLANPKATPKSPVGLIRTASGEEFNATSLNLAEDKLKFKTGTIPESELDWSHVREIDFGGGRIRFLAELPFDDSESVHPDSDFPVVWFTAKNSPAGTGGRRPLTIGDQEYLRGLWIHSGGLLRFRLNRQFTELRATAGFEETYLANMPRFDPKVRLVISGDGNELYSHEFLWSGPPEAIRVDLSGVREMIIRVDSLGQRKGILEHFALGDAQVIK